MLTAWKKNYGKPRQHIKKSHHFADKGRDSQAMVLPLVMYICESWTIKKAEHWRIDAFELSCWRRLLRVPWTASRSNQSILKEINPEYIHWKDLYWSWSFSTLARPADAKSWCIGKDLDAGKIEGRRRKGWRDEMVRWYIDSLAMSLSRLGDSEGQGSLLCCRPRDRKELNVTEQLNSKM